MFIFLWIKKKVYSFFPVSYKLLLIVVDIFQSAPDSRLICHYEHINRPYAKMTGIHIRLTNLVLEFEIQKNISLERGS